MATRPHVDFTPTVPALLGRAVARFGERDLLMMPGLHLSFRQAEQQSKHLAKHLLRSGVGKGTRVGMQFAYSPEFLVAFLAVTRIGALAVPFSTAYAENEMRRALRRSDVHTLLIPPALLGRSSLDFLERVEPALVGASADLFLEQLPHLRRIYVLGHAVLGHGVPGHGTLRWAVDIDLAADLTDISDALLSHVEDDVSPADLLVAIQTSGSTAEPKGVLHTHGAVIRKTATTMPGDIDEPPGPHSIYAAMPMFWIGGLISLFSALAHGTTMVCQERFDLEGALDLIEQERCVTVYAWVGVLAAMQSSPSLSRRDLSATPALTPPPANRAFFGALGMTETIGPHFSIPPVETHAALPQHLRGGNGVSAEHFEHKVIRPDGSDVIGDGAGELCIRGDALLADMYKRERHEVFDVDGWYHTGDLVRRTGELYFFTGRSTEMIKTNGNNVAPPEVESALGRAPGVRVAYVFGLPDAQRGEIVAAVVVPDEGTVLDEPSLLEHARLELSSYKVPRALAIVPETAIPTLATGKPDKRAMRDQLIRDRDNSGALS
jgi:acyl-CoA synthetase (AMP-forming)/AMP-acid ligase II